MRFEATEIASAGVVGKNDNLAAPVVLGVVAMEHDEGSAEEAEGKVRNAIQEIEKKFDQAAGQLAGTGGNHVIPEWARDILIGWVPEGVAAVFGLADDKIGQTPVLLFDDAAALLANRQLPVQGKFGENNFNLTVPVDGGPQGKYELFFMVDLRPLHSDRLIRF